MCVTCCDTMQQQQRRVCALALLLTLTVEWGWLGLGAAWCSSYTAVRLCMGPRATESANTMGVGRVQACCGRWVRAGEH
jgi:hypothetical protein